jgi:methionine-rich copper-binding protein CopC
MKRQMAIALCVAAAFVVASCSSTSNPSSVPADPTVDSMSPADGATDVGLIQRVEIGFSEAIDPATVNGTTLVVTARGVTGSVEYDESSDTVTFTPDTLYAASSWFDVVVSGEVADLEGNLMGQDETSSFQTGVLDCAHLTDYMEPNESIAQAAHIELARTYRTLSGCDSDTDFFEFTLTATAKVLPLAEFKRANDELCYVYIRRYTGEDYGYMGSYVDDDNFLGGSYTLMPGTYYAEVVGTGGYEDYILYDFSVNTTTPCDDDAYEDNDFFDEATPIAPGLHTNLRGCRVDRDYYSFQADAGETITLTFEVQQGGVDTRQYGIYGPALENLELYAGWGDPVTIQAIAAESGTHYAFVRYWYDGYIYDMEVTVED